MKREQQLPYPKVGERVRIDGKWSLHHKQVGVVIDRYQGLHLVQFNDGAVGAYDHAYDEMAVCDVEA